jgi:uncharacterized Rmd1/YagE family protein
MAAEDDVPRSATSPSCSGSIRTSSGSMHRSRRSSRTRERLAALERKLDFVARTVRTLLDLIRTKHSLRVEWYIVGLIAAEILLSLYEMWLR